MGSAIGAFAQGIQNTLGKKLEEKHQEEEGRKKEQRDALYSILLNPQVSDAGHQMAMEQLQKLYNPESKKGLAKIAPQLSQIFQKIRGQQGKQQPQGQQPAPAPQTQAATSGQVPPGTQVPAPQQQPQPQAASQRFKQGPDFAGMMQGYGSDAEAREDARKRSMLKYESDLKIGQERAKVASVAQRRESLIQSYMETYNVSHEEAEKRLAKTEVDKQEGVKKHNLQAGWAKPPDGKTIAVRIDPQDPGKVFNANTGQPVPEGTEQYNPSEVTAQMRQDSYGSFGNYYRAALGKGMTAEQARAEAASKVDREFNVRLERQEQNIAIDQAISGIGGGGSAPSASTGGGGGPKPAPTSKLDTKNTPSGLTPTDQDNIDTYLGDLLGTMKVPTKGSARKIAGMRALARITGLDPMALNAALVEDKATGKALAQAVEVSGAFGRVQETLKAHSDVLLKAAQDYGPGGIPLANRTVQWLQQNASSHPELQRYIIALNAVQREYGRLVAGGVQSRAMLPVSATEKGEQVLRKDATIKDVIAAVDQLKIEADTEQKAFQNQIAGLRSKLGSGSIGEASRGGATSTPKKAPGSVPKTAEDYLKSISQ